MENCGIPENGWSLKAGTFFNGLEICSVNKLVYVTLTNSLKSKILVILALKLSANAETAKCWCFCKHSISHKELVKALESAKLASKSNLSVDSLQVEWIMDMQLGWALRSV